MSDISVRRARRSDVPTLGRLGADLVRTHFEFDPKRFLPMTPQTEQGYGTFLAGQLDRSDSVLLVAERGGEIVGYAYGTVEGYDYMSLRGPAGVLNDIVVDPAQRGRGIGRMLLEATLDELKARGVPRVVLSTAEQNAAAQHLFERAGFRRTMIEMTRELSA
jgi:ribosomal protein S18 acetylase RimI-like enzyme